MIERLRNLPRPRRHPPPRTLSRYLEGDLDVRARHLLEAHLRDCRRCRRLLASLKSTVRALGSIGEDTAAGLADSIVETLRAQSQPENAIPARSQDRTGLTVLTSVPSSGRPPVGNRIPDHWPRRARAAFRYCLQRPQLRLTLPITVVAGVVLSLVNMGGTLLHGRIDLGVCVMCATDFLVPFVALNLGLLIVLGIPERRRRAG